MKNGGIIVFAFFSGKRGIVCLIIMALILPILVISYGYMTNMPHKKYTDNHRNGQGEENRDSHTLEIDELAKSISGEKQVLTLDETVIHKKYIYRFCGHSDKGEELIRYSDIGLSRMEFSNKYLDWAIKSFSSDKIIMEKVLDGYCPRHYILQELNGVIAIYQPDIDSQLDIIKQTDIPVDYLPQELQDQIRDGLAVETLEEIEDMIEDIDS